MKKISAASARRYARALFDVALAKNQAEQVNAGLSAFGTALKSHRELASTLTDPTLGADKKSAVVRALVGDQGSPLVGQFLRILVDEGCIAEAPATAEAFTALWNSHRNVAKADVVSSHALDAGEVEALRGALKKMTGCDVEIRSEVDASLVGGLVVSVAGKTYDGSVRAQLHELRSRLTGRL